MSKYCENKLYLISKKAPPLFFWFGQKFCIKFFLLSLHKNCIYKTHQWEIFNKLFNFILDFLQEKKKNENNIKFLRNNQKSLWYLTCVEWNFIWFQPRPHLLFFDFDKMFLREAVYSVSIVDWKIILQFDTYMKYTYNKIWENNCEQMMEKVNQEKDENILSMSSASQMKVYL